MTQLDYPAGRTTPAFSIVSILAVIAAIGSFMVGPGLALILAIVAIVFGAIGVLLSLLPSTRGGIVSFLSIAAGAIGIVVALIRIVGRIA
jgi:hypothetical protein